MKVTLCEHAGFCYGVQRAVDTAFRAAEEPGEVWCLGKLIHNDDCMRRLAEKGVKVAASAEEIPEGARVIIRAHGEPESTYEILRQKKCEIIDATCRFVEKIHKIAKNQSFAGCIIVIIGDGEHPEVRGILGHCAQGYAIGSEEELSAFFDRVPADSPLCVVYQTTSERKKAEIFASKLKNHYTNLEEFDTICNATYLRQSSAALLAAKCDGMIVIGGKDSANTGRLYDVCRDICPNTAVVENAAGLDKTRFAGAKHIGITAGASTPAWIIKEVHSIMSEEIKNTETVESFAELLENSIITIHTGEKVVGTVTHVGATEIQLDLGTKHAGYISADDFSDNASQKLDEVVKVGDQIECIVVKVSDVEGTVTLSKKRLDAVKGWEIVEQAAESHETVEGFVTEENKGGIVVSVNGVRVFVPASMTGIPKGQPLTDLLKKNVKLKITEMNRGRRRIIGSIRDVNSEARKAAAAALWAEIEIGKVYEGTVKSLTAYGAFIDIGGVDGMCHITELGWGRYKNPADVVSVGDKLTVRVINLDTEKKKISLSCKNPDENPWTLFTEKYAVGSVAEVTVNKLMPFGAFAEIIPGVDGLIHISQIADRRINRPGEVLSEGQKVDAKIINIDEENHKVSLSIRALLEGADEADEADEADAE
ncbi:MAG: bifunctional 4-hydroxy-3-methylbut-2-enyl diphosphate reductase/30S ribosomal protein S1 [Clostridia bacterium]|nr:bifunctional 4-hydroxy-3-methylbut-2-enyl diphosphate reductase/30S ribosomal protein S1 [Clostridia bacterium]